MSRPIYRSRILRFFSTAKHGYDQTYWIFVLLGSGALLNQAFGIAGPISVVVVFFFFYWMGRIHFKIEEGRKSMKDSGKKYRRTT